MKRIFLLLTIVVVSLAALADAPLRRPINESQPAWFIHIDNWNDADPQKIIDLIPADIKPYVIFNISMSISHDETTGEFNRVPDGYSAARSWLRVCAENNLWAMVQCSSGGFSHFPEDDLRFYEELYREYPNFVGWNYAEQFWGFDDKFSCSADERLNHFADLMKLARKYGGYTCISFCGNIWSRALSPMAMMKRNAAFAKQAAEAPQNLIICDKYTMSSMFYEYESMNFGMLIGGYTTNYGIRFDQCGWNGELDSEKENMPAAAGAAPVLNNWLLTGGTVNDGPELIWQQDFKTNGTKTLADGYVYRDFQRFPQFDNVSIDLYRKILDGTIRIPSREEVIKRHKLVIIQDVQTGDESAIYGAPDDLYDGLYNMNDAEHVHDQKTWFKKTGRYPTIPIVKDLVDGLANSIETQINQSKLSSRWSTISKKQAEFNALFPEEYTGNAFAGRVDNRWLIYNPLKTGETASAAIPLQYNTSESVEMTMSQYTSCIMTEWSDKIEFYLNNYRTDVTSLKNDIIIIKGVSTKPTMTWKDRSSHTASQIVEETWQDGTYRVVIAHNGPLDMTINCAGGATERKQPVAARQLTIPADPAPYYGPVTHECEDFDYKNTSGYKLAPWAQSTTKGFAALGFHEFGTSNNAMIRDTFIIAQAGKHNAIIRYSAPNGAPRLKFYVGSTSKIINLPKTLKDEWKEYTVKDLTFAEGKNQVRITSYGNQYNLYLDQVTIVNPEYKVPTAINVDKYELSLNAYVGKTGVDSLYVNGRSLTSPISIVTDGEFSVSLLKDGEFSSAAFISPDDNGNVTDQLVYVRLESQQTIGKQTGSVTFTSEGCLEHVTSLSGKVTPAPVKLLYDFTNDVAKTYASNPPASGITIASGALTTAGVASYLGDKMLKVYSTNGRNGSAALDLNRFTKQSTDYSVSWRQYNLTTNDYKVGMMMRAGNVVGTSSAGYAQGFRSGYLFLAYNNSNSTELRIYKSTTDTNLKMMASAGVSIMSAVGTPLYYRASVSGYPIVTLTFEYSTDGTTWHQGLQTVDSTNPFSNGATQLAWGLSAMGNNFLVDDITYEGVTYDTTVGVRGISAEEKPSEGNIYNLGGQKVRNMNKGGIYVSDGMKFVK